MAKDYAFIGKKAFAGISNSYDPDYSPIFPQVIDLEQGESLKLGFVDEHNGNHVALLGFNELMDQLVLSSKLVADLHLKQLRRLDEFDWVLVQLVLMLHNLYQTLPLLFNGFAFFAFFLVMAIPFQYFSTLEHGRFYFVVLVG